MPHDLLQIKLPYGMVARFRAIKKYGYHGATTDFVRQALQTEIDKERTIADAPKAARINDNVGARRIQDDRRPSHRAKEVNRATSKVRAKKKTNNRSKKINK